MINKVVLSKKARKGLSRLPRYIVENLEKWIESVEVDGLDATRKIPGLHDEPLKGERKGQRSIRLSRSYRAIYIVKKEAVEFVEIQEVNKHEY